MDPDQVDYYRMVIANVTGSNDISDMGQWRFYHSKNKLLLEFVSVDLKLSEYGGTMHEESEAYPLDSLVSDIGGALGLVLGLSKGAESGSLIIWAR